MDIEDKRVGDVAEGILYEFLPSAFNAIIPPCGDPRSELTHGRCKVVASAALSIGALMNAPPPFLEFLLRIPWQKIEELHQKWQFHVGSSCRRCVCSAQNQEWIQQQLEIPDMVRRELVNTPIDSALMPTVLEFLFSETFKDSLPPQLKPATEPPFQSHLDAVAAMLDGAGPLHCAAIRGNPAQVDHLLFCGADPSIKTHPGDLALQLVPFCGEKSSATGQRICRCMNPKDQEIWECRSASARSLISRKSLVQIGHGLVAWLTMLVLCILNSLGLWGCHVDHCSRTSIRKHVEHQKEVKSTKAYLESKRLLNEMRKEARQGQQFLAAARQVPWNKGEEKEHNQEIRRSEEGVTQKAFLSYVHAVHFLQNLLLHNDGKEFQATPETTPPSLPKVTAPDCQVSEDEQADLYCSWAESVLLKFKACRCAGCAAVAVSAIRMAHLRCAQLLSHLEKRPMAERVDKWRSVGSNLMHVVYLHICLLLDTEASQSATKASMWRSEQCVKEWKRLEEKGFAFGACDTSQVTLLDQWVCAAESDLMLAEALYGDTLSPSQTVQKIVSITVTRSSAGLPYLVGSTSLENVDSLETALNKAKAPSSDLAALTVEVMQNGKREVQAAANLQECLSAKGTTLVTGMIDKLSEAILAAEPFPRLAMKVNSAHRLHQTLLSRAEAIERLEVIMLQAKQPLMMKNDDSSCPTIEASLIEERISALQLGIEQGKKARINTEKARKLLRELQAQMSAVEAARQLDAVMAKKPCGSAALKTALTKAEGCYSSASGHVASGMISMSAFLLPRMQAARKRLEIERVVESLDRATATYITVNDLSKLESIILDARKVFDQFGAEESDQTAYHAARSLRGTLHNASKVREQLQNGVKALQKHQRKVDAVALEEMIQNTTPCRSLLEEDTAKAQQALDHWNSIQEMEEHLSQVIQEAAQSSEVSRAVHDASIAGVKTQGAKKILKLMQNVENAMHQLTANVTKCTHLKSTIDEAEKGGVGQKLVTKARSLLADTQALQAQEALVNALDEKGQDLEERSRNLRSALDHAASLMDCPVSVNLALSEELSALDQGESFGGESEEFGQLKRFHVVWDYVERVRSEICSCEAEMVRIKLNEAEKQQQKKDNERQEKKRLEEAKRAAEQREIVRKQREKEETARKEEEAKRQRQQHMGLLLQQSLEKQEKEREKRAGQFRRLLVNPNTSKALIETAPSSVFSRGEDSMAKMEYEVRRLLEDDSPSKSEKIMSASSGYPIRDANLTAKGVLERLDDPWDVQSTGEPLQRPCFSAQEFTPLSKLPTSLIMRQDFGHVVAPAMDPLEALLARKSLVDSMMMQREMMFGATHPMVSWSRPMAPGILPRRTSALDSSAPAFYPSAPPEGIELGKGIHAFSSPTTSSALLSPFKSAGRRLEMPVLKSRAETQRPAVGPFPGVGAGIPGTPSRSLSEKMDHMRQSSLTRSEKEPFSRSGEL